jgi:hypothetical protein
MWHDRDAVAVGLTRVAARTAHATHTPTWVIVLGIGLGVLLMLWLGWALVSAWRPPGLEGGDDHGSGPGGGGPGRPGPHGGEPPGGAETWWPDFEREFSAYVSERYACAVDSRGVADQRCDER